MDLLKNYDLSAIPECCGDHVFNFQEKKGQLVAHCSSCKRYVCCVPKLRVGGTTNSKTLLNRKVAQLGSVYCQMCLRTKKSAPDFFVTNHHLIPLAHGGTDALDNIMLLCRDCHDIIHSIRKLVGTNNSRVGHKAQVHERMVGCRTREQVEAPERKKEPPSAGRITLAELAAQLNAAKSNAAEKEDEDEPKDL